MLVSREECSSQKCLKSYKVGDKIGACLRRLETREMGIMNVKGYHRIERQFYTVRNSHRLATTYLFSPNLA